MGGEWVQIDPVPEFFVRLKCLGVSTDPSNCISLL